MVILALLLFESPRILFQEDFDCLFEGVIGIDFACDFLSGYGLYCSFDFIVLFQDLALIAESFFRNDRIFHEHEGDLADEIIRYFWKLLSLSNLSI